MSTIIAKWGFPLIPEYLKYRELFKVLCMFIRKSFSSGSFYLPSHGDVTEYNLLFMEDGKIAFFDFTNFSHARPFLYDALFLCCHRRISIKNWGWQKDFFNRYLEKAGNEFGISPGAKKLSARVRAIMLFLMIYWMFNTRRKLSRDSKLMDEIVMRKKDLELLLDNERYDEWFKFLCSKGN